MFAILIQFLTGSNWYSYIIAMCWIGKVLDVAEARCTGSNTAQRLYDAPKQQLRKCS